MADKNWKAFLKNVSTISQNRLHISSKNLRKAENVHTTEGFFMTKHVFKQILRNIFKKVLLNWFKKHTFAPFKAK